jgi:hypothetical protein
LVFALALGSASVACGSLVEGYRESLHRDPPESVMKALGK